MDEKNKLSEEVRKQFNELLRNKKFNEAINLIEPFANCLFTIDWGDGQVEEINNEKGKEIHAEHTYVRM